MSKLFMILVLRSLKFILYHLAYPDQAPSAKTKEDAALTCRVSMIDLIGEIENEVQRLKA